MELLKEPLQVLQILMVMITFLNWFMLNKLTKKV